MYFQFTFQSDHPGMYKESWVLKTYPKLGDFEILFKLEGLTCTGPLKTPWSYIENHLKNCINIAANEQREKATSQHFGVKYPTHEEPYK